MSDTPRTDAAAVLVSINDDPDQQHPKGPYVPREVSEKLERENAALRELLHHSLFWLDDYDSRVFSGSAKIADDIKEVLRKEAQP